jgi:hypothetical protein
MILKSVIPESCGLFGWEPLPKARPHPEELATQASRRTRAGLSFCMGHSDCALHLMAGIFGEAESILSRTPVASNGLWHRLRRREQSSRHFAISLLR